MGLLDILTTEGKKFIKDALPGGRLNPEVTPQGLLDTAALVTAPVPLVGDAVGLGADAYRLAKNPEERTPLNFGLAALGALPFVPAGIFIGKGAKTWDALAASKATKMEQAGTDPRAIWKETGTFKGPDGHWRQEIPDNTSKLTLGRIKPDAYGAQEAKTFEGAVKHQQLKRAYPELNDVSFTHWPDENYLGASFNPRESAITMGRDAMGQPGVHLHELQHAIQQREGWANGGSPKWFEKNELPYAELVKRNYKTQDQYIRARANGGIDPDTGLSAELLRRAVDEAVSRVKNWLPPEEKYRRLAGEAEARAVEARQNLNAQQRRDLFPLDSYDVPIDQLIIRK